MNHHAFRTTANGKISDPGTDLGTLGGDISTAYSINNKGQTVGNSNTANGQTHPFFVDVTGPMIDLNSLLPANSGWDLFDAHAINDRGQIVGSSVINNRIHAYLLTVPEPAALPLLAIGAIALYRRRRR